MKLDRRSVVRNSLLGASALAMPALLRAHDALASSGTVSVAAWGDYFGKNSILEDFEKATGIKVNLSTYGSNEEIENKLRAAGGRGFDVLFPSVDTGPNYYKDSLLQPIDENKLNTSQVIPAIYRQSLRLGAAHRGKRMLVPFDWGTEGITYDSSLIEKGYGEISYGDLWADGFAKKVALRQKSVLAGLALLMDANGTMATDRGMLPYKSEEDCRKVFDRALKWVADHKSNISAFWNNANEATAAFKDAGSVIGLTWDTTAILLNSSIDPKWKYTMPKEGGLAWTDTIAIPAGAANIEQAYSFANFLLKPEIGAAFANATGYNSCAVDAEKFLDDKAKAFFSMAYPGDAIGNLWWWPVMPGYFAKVRGEYVEKITAIVQS